jgi:hypothetical protein
MADDFTIATRDGDKDVRAVEVSSGLYQPVQKVAPHMPTVISGGQYNQTVSSSAFTITVPSGATHCLVTVSDDAVNYTEDGTTPTAASGLRLPEGFVGELAIPQALKFVRVTTNALVNITYRKYT